MNIKSNKICNLIGMICLLIGAGVLVRTACLVGVSDIWFDELFTVELASKPLPELVRLASGDVHPPLYYIIVRGVYLLLGAMVDGIRIEIAAKIASIIPFFLIMIYAVTYVRARFGWLSTGLLVLFVETMPQLPQFMVEARMYSWAMFVVLAMLIHGMEAVRDCGDVVIAGGMQGKTEQGNMFVHRYVHLVIACIYGIVAMYLHYYAFIGAAAIGLGLLVYVGVRARAGAGAAAEPTKGIGWISVVGCMAVCLVAYIPWIKTVMSQVGAVKSSYWIPPVTIRTLAGCVKYIFKPEFESNIVNYMCVGVMLGAYVVCFVRYLMGKPGGVDVRMTAAVPVILVLVGFVASLIIRPIFVYRYLTPVMGVFWLGYAIVFGAATEYVIEKLKQRESSKHGSTIVCLIAIVLWFGVMLTVSRRDFNMFKWEEQKKSAGMEVTETAFELIRNDYSDCKLVCNFNQVQAVLWHYLDNDSILWGETEETLIAEICDRYPIVMTEDADELLELTSSEIEDHSYGESSAGSSSFIFIGSGNARDEIIENWAEQGLKAELLVDSCLLERYYFNVYYVSQ